uniref:NTPase KAP family P-loop domain-containing protein 1-like n=1 Tax=Phallusia mammillata TaxID=59560 RepID=A0A6F9DMZ1_9ASCI|nr:NTPase KAP family P-loop domain-containing protein 1-like [Phallusia mammillata]
MDYHHSKGDSVKSETPHDASYSRMADVLGDTISFRPPPLTVGVFGKWGTGKSRMLKLIRERIETNTSSKEKQSNSLSLGLFALIYRLLFFNPNFHIPKSKDIKFVFVDFSILDYAGTDQLWAGIITHISSKIEEVFGSWSVRVFRAWNYKPDKDLKAYLVTCDEHPQKNCKDRWTLSCTSVFMVTALIAIVVLVIVLFSIYGFPQFSTDTGEVFSAVVTTSLAAMLGLGVASKIGDIFRMVFNLVKTQAEKVKAMANEENFSSNLGFMYKVKTEVYYITSLVRYAGLFLEKDIRLCLIIDDIDILTSERAKGLFQVVSLLQSSPSSPYIQILCMDPYIAASIIKKSLNSEFKNGHAFLRKHIELPFHIPCLDEKNKMQYLVSSGPIRRLAGLRSPKQTPKLNQNQKDETIPLVDVVTVNASHYKPKLGSFCSEDDYAQSWNTVRTCFLSNPSLLTYIDGNELRVQRILSSTQLAVRLIDSVGPKVPEVDVKKLASWIILVDQWPYRLSCMWQAIEDNSQLYELDPNAAYKFSPTSRLRDLYPLIIQDIKAVKTWRDFLELDADPEIFGQFLSAFPLTVGDLKEFLPYTTNLDRSIRRIVANAIVKNRISNKPALKEHIKRWKHQRPLETWSVEDVCNEFNNIGLNEKNLEAYLKLIKDHDIDGKTLRRVAPSDIKKQLKMSLGDWVSAKEHFAALQTFFGEKRKSLSLDPYELLTTSVEECCSENFSESDV